MTHPSAHTGPAGAHLALTRGPDVAMRSTPETLAELLVTRGRCDSSAVLVQAVNAAVAAVPGARWGSLSQVRDGRRLGPRASTGTEAGAADTVQQLARQGPSLTAAATGTAVLVDHLPSDARWPEVMARCPSVCSVLSVPLPKAAGPGHTLTLYSDVPAAFGPSPELADAVGAAATIAALALAALELRDRSDTLTAGLASSRRIGAAVGIVMTRQLLTEEQAFAVLRAVSQAQDRKLRLIADEVLLTGDLPPADPDVPGPLPAR